MPMPSERQTPIHFPISPVDDPIETPTAEPMDIPTAEPIDIPNAAPRDIPVVMPSVGFCSVCGF